MLIGDHYFPLSCIDYPRCFFASLRFPSDKIVFPSIFFRKRLLPVSVFLPVFSITLSIPLAVQLSGLPHFSYYFLTELFHHHFSSSKQSCLLASASNPIVYTTGLCWFAKIHPISQSSFFFNIIDSSLSKVNSIWSQLSVICLRITLILVFATLPTLPTRKNLVKWGIPPTSDCPFSLLPETLLHVVLVCNIYLIQGKYTCHHDSILTTRFYRKHTKYNDLITQDEHLFSEVKYIN